MQKITITFLFLLTCIVNAQELKVYQIYNQKEKKVDFGKMISELAKYDVVLFGEHHNNAVNHWLQLETTKALYQQKNGQITLGAEMFERHQQKELSNYITNKIDDKTFQSSTSLWPNYKTDYKPLVDFARENKLLFIATNATRKFASYVSKNGLASLDTISKADKSNIAKLPFEIDYDAPGYPEMIKMMGEHAGLKAKQFVAAQALKDVTMAESILLNHKQGNLFIHFNGDYHSKSYGGIYWFLKKANPNLKVAVIEVLEAEGDILSIDKAKDESYVPTDFIIVFPSTSPKTY